LWKALAFVQKNGKGSTGTKPKQGRKYHNRLSEGVTRKFSNVTGVKKGVGRRSGLTRGGFGKFFLGKTAELELKHPL